MNRTARRRLARLCRRWLCSLAVLIPLAALLAACGDSPSAERVVRVVVPDESASAFERNLTLGEKAFKLGLADAAAHDGIAVVLAVTGDTAGESVMPVHVDFGARPPELPKDELFVNNWKQQTQTRALRAYKDWQAKAKPAKGTDYVGAFLVADRLLAGLPNGDRQVWIVGDAFQNAGGWNMYKEHPTAPSCQRRAAGLKAGGHLGSLWGAAVTFIGGGLNTRQVLSPTEQADLTACWAAIVHTAGGQTPAGWWNPARLMAGP
jgi:hypothetical protein